MKRLIKKYLLNRSQSAGTLIVLAILLSFHFVWAEAQSFQKMVKEFQQSTIIDFIGFTLKGERYPLMHTISELRFRVFTEKLGINRKAEIWPWRPWRNGWGHLKNWDVIILQNPWNLTWLKHSLKLSSVLYMKSSLQRKKSKREEISQLILHPGNFSHGTFQWDQ